MKLLTGVRVITDWHNLGYSIVTNVHHFSETSPVVRLLRAYELLVPRLFDTHLTVTDALRAFLIRQGYPADAVVTFHDKPATIISREFADRVALLSRLQPSFPDYAQGIVSDIVAGDASVVCAVSSTSWTPDEDFGVLFDALCAYDRRTETLPRVVVFITGKGPLRAEYERRIREAALQRVCIVPVWLEHADYPELLACCDFGVSLHARSSKLDLPMKVLDMFGCTIPVLAFDYPTLREELVVDGETGRTFATAQELEQLLVEFVADGCAEPHAMRTRLRSHD